MSPVVFLHLKTHIFCISQTNALILQLNLYKMKRIVLAFCAGLVLLTSCNQYNNVLKSTDYEYKYEVAKECFVRGQYTRAATLLGELVTAMKGTFRAEETLYMLAMAEYCDGNYDVASSYFKKYCQSYPKGKYVEYARFYTGKALFESVPDVRLDQTNTFAAIQALQEFLDYCRTCLFQSTPVLWRDRPKNHSALSEKQGLNQVVHYKLSKLFVHKAPH